jgi:hypothetical protein
MVMTEKLGFLKKVLEWTIGIKSGLYEIPVTIIPLIKYQLVNNNLSN